MPRYILRYCQPAVPAEHLAAIRSAPKVRVVEETPRMVLVEATEQDLRDLLTPLAGWTVHAETMVPLPDPRKKIT
jgi:hypothetical protein